MSEVQPPSEIHLENLTPIKAEYADPSDVFYLEWHEATVKASPGVLNDSLNRIITLSTAMLGGSIIFLQDNLMDRMFRMAMILAFALSLLAAFVGTWPRDGQVDSRSPEDIRLWKEYVIDHKTMWFRVAGCALVAGFVFAVGGMVLKI